MKISFKPLFRYGITLALLLAALGLGSLLWNSYMNRPWTRDGRIRADVVNVSSDVSGIVTAVSVHDNQYVHRGDVLFQIDPIRYRQALALAQANLDHSRALLAMKRDQAARRARLDDQVVSRESRSDAVLNADSAQAEYAAALAERDQAQLNLDRTLIRSPVDGWITNLLVRPGDYARAGDAKLALVDQHSFWADGYFEENKVALIQVGDPVEVRLLGSSRVLRGHVDSIARGISDRDNPADPRLLANVNPTFNWVRLAQRVPVRIALDPLPADVVLAAGMTCTVVVRPASAEITHPSER